MKNEYKVTRDLMMNWAKDYLIIGKTNVFLFVLWCVVGLIGIFLLSWHIMYGGTITSWYITALIVFVSVFKLFFSRFFVMSNRYKLLSKTYGVSMWVRSVEFTKDDIIICDHTSVTKLLYQNLKGIKEMGNKVYIIFNNNTAFIIYKNAFTEGTWEECERKLRNFIK